MRFDLAYGLVDAANRMEEQAMAEARENTQGSSRGTRKVTRIDSMESLESFMRMGK